MGVNWQMDSLLAIGRARSDASALGPLGRAHLRQPFAIATPTPAANALTGGPWRSSCHTDVIGRRRFAGLGRGKRAGYRIVFRQRRAGIGKIISARARVREMLDDRP
jgi:hypothetical protein